MKKLLVLLLSTTLGLMATAQTTGDARYDDYMYPERESWFVSGGPVKRITNIECGDPGLQMTAVAFSKDTGGIISMLIGGTYMELLQNRVGALREVKPLDLNQGWFHCEYDLGETPGSVHITQDFSDGRCHLIYSNPNQNLLPTRFSATASDVDSDYKVEGDIFYEDFDKYGNPLVIIFSGNETYTEYDTETGLPINTSTNQPFHSKTIRKIEYY